MRVLDDLDSRPGSASSLLRTIIGVSLRECGGWLSSSSFIELMGTVGVDAARTRTALSRVKQKGLLDRGQRNGEAGYELTAEGQLLLGLGDRRIYTYRSMDENDPWCLIAFSIPEEHRKLRHQLRKHLQGIGAGAVSAALWIVPAYLREEVEGIVTDLNLEACVTLFTASGAASAKYSVKELVCSWWDLAELSKLHESFLARHHRLTDKSPVTSGAEIFGYWIQVLDAWRPIPYLDPGLPASCLPEDWPGSRSLALFTETWSWAQVPVADYLSRFARR